MYALRSQLRCKQPSDCCSQTVTDDQNVLRFCTLVNQEVPSGTRIPPNTLDRWMAFAIPKSTIIHSKHISVKTRGKRCIQHSPEMMCSCASVSVQEKNSRSFRHSRGYELPLRKLVFNSRAWWWRIDDLAIEWVGEDEPRAQRDIV